MYKIFMTIRNRLAITRKAIDALYKHATMPFQLYVYDNSTNYLIDEHFKYFSDLYKEKKITQVTFTTKDSVFNAFDKASTSNFFGLQHEQDPRKREYDFLLIMDNDIIVQPNFDEILLKAWKDVKNHKMDNIHVINQNPGGIVQAEKIPQRIAGYDSYIGKNSGSAFWCTQNDFFHKIGFLDLNKLVGFDKRHDIFYWRCMDLKNNGKKYVLGLNAELRIHCGSIAGSVCNALTKRVYGK